MRKIVIKVIIILHKNMLNPNTLWDCDLLISRDPSGLYPIDFSRKGTFRLYSDYDKGIKYGKISKSDASYNEIKIEAKRNGVEVVEIGDILFVNLRSPSEKPQEGKIRGRDISLIPGVLKDPFTIWKNGREYVRYRFIKEAAGPISDILMKGLNRLKDEGENFWKIEYLGNHTDDISFFKKYDYPRRILQVTVRENDSSDALHFFPHYSSPHIMFFLLGENNKETERVIRFSESVTGYGGIIRESKLLRDGTIKIYEDMRNVTSFSVSSLSREPFAAFPIQFYQLYNGKEVLLNWWIDEDDLNFLLTRIKKFNEINKDEFNLVLNKIDFIL